MSILAKLNNSGIKKSPNVPPIMRKQLEQYVLTFLLSPPFNHYKQFTKIKTYYGGYFPFFIKIIIKRLNKGNNSLDFNLCNAYISFKVTFLNTLFVKIN